MWIKLVVAVLVFFAHCCNSQSVTLKATISNGGVKANVTLTQSSPGANVTLTYQLSGPNSANVVSWELRQHRVMYDVNGRCNVSRLGAKVYPSGSGTWTTSTTTLSAGILNLSGLNSIEGLSLALFQSGQSDPLACGNVEMEADYITARATFREGIMGKVTFRQSGSALTRVTYSLQWPAVGSDTSLAWRVVGTADCSAVGEPFNPASANPDCNTTQQSSCATGDLTGKLGPVAFASATKSARGNLVDLTLPLGAASNVLGKALQLISNSGSSPQLVACAVITAYSAKNAIAQFSNDGISGSVTLTQHSPLDPTEVKVELSGLQQKAGGWHVHMWPVPQRVDSSQELCSGASVSGHFNPFGIVVANSPPAGTSTEDLYEIGDLSGKFGVLNAKDELSATYMDTNLPLFGMQSVMGRSIVIHKSESGAPRWVCANIRDTAAVTFALATFTFPVIGHVLMQQQVGDPFGDTSVLVQLDFADGTTDSTTGHSLKVHASMVNDDFLSDDAAARCVSAGAVYMPFSVTGGTCAPDSPLQCSVGDLSGKNGAVSVRGTKVFVTDVSLPLQGDQMIVGHSLVLNVANGGSSMLACANILRLQPLQAVVSGWAKTSTDFGKVTFTQRVGLIEDPTKVQWDLHSLPTTSTIGHQIHSHAKTDDQCSSLGDVFNPFVASTPGSTKDTFPVGDLSGKFGNLTGPIVTMEKPDPNLDLWGPRSVLGHAMTLAWGDSVGACADVMAQSTMGGQLVRAKAVFTGDITGDIQLSQYVYDNGAEMPTTVVVNLRRANGSQTMQHNWHTHEKQVLGDAMADTGRCSSTGGHYNPFKVNMQDTYSTECKPSNPLRCELGDQTGKLGTYDMASGTLVVSDPYLPLTGKFGVVGRSIVIHAENKGSPRIACADILPATIATSAYVTIATPASLDKASIRAKISEVLNTPIYNVVVEWTSHNTQLGCSGLRVYFIGQMAEELQQQMENILRTNAESLGDYKPYTCTACVPVTSLLLMLVSILAVKFLQ